MICVQSDKRRNLFLFIFLAFVFVSIFCWIWVQEFNSGPDEEMRYQIVEYIVKHWSLPDGRDFEIMNETWGISYGYYPILAYMIMAVPAKIVSLFTNSDFMAVLIAARIVNAVFGTLMAYFVFRTSELLFKSKAKYLFTALTVFLPMNIFIHSYVNNDSMALMATAWIIFVCASSIKNGWTKKLCVSYACATSICILSYYNAYGIILCSMIFFFVTVMAGYTGDKKARYFSERVVLIVIIVVALAAWWFIRNAILYDGDFLGMRTSSISAELYAADGFKPSQVVTLSDQGYNVFSLLGFDGWEQGDWAKMVAMSFIGVFGPMNIFMPGILYKIYIIVFFAGFVGCVLSLKKLFAFRVSVNGKKALNKTAVFNWCMLLHIIITFALLVYYNLYKDIQPQGRYLLPALVPFMYFVTIGIERIFDLIIRNEKVKTILYYVGTALLVVTSVYVYIAVLYPTGRF